MDRLQRILLTKKPFFSRSKCRFGQKKFGFCHFQYEDFYCNIFSQFLYHIALGLLSRVRSHFGNIFSEISIIEMITRVTNYDVTSDAINAVRLTITVPSTFKMLLLIYCLIYAMIAIKYSTELWCKQIPY